MDNVDVQQIAEDALPARADFLAAGLAAGVEQFVNRAAVRILSSDEFQKVWVEANRRAHSQLDKALTGEGTLQTRNGKVVLDLSAIVESVRLQLKERGIGIFDRIPIDNLAIQLNIIDAKQIDNARSATKLLNQLSWALPIVSLLCLGGGLALSSNRRRSLIRWGIGAAFAVALIGAGIAIGRSFYLDAVTSPSLPEDTAAAVFDTLVASCGTASVWSWHSRWSSRSPPGSRVPRGGDGHARDRQAHRRWRRGVRRFARGDVRRPRCVGCPLPHRIARRRGAARVGRAAALEPAAGGTVLGLAILLLIALVLIEFVGRAGVTGVSEKESTSIVSTSPPATTSPLS